MGLADVSNVLWRERELLELLLFKLEEEQLVLAGGRTRWLARATKEVDLVLDQIRHLEVLRAAEVDAVAAELGLPPNPSLAVLAEAAGPPWTDLLHEHRRTYLTLTAEITSLAAVNRDLLTAGQRAVRESLLAVSGTVELYGPRGGTVPETKRARLVDEAV